jgi:hypothetical protein
MELIDGIYVSEIYSVLLQRNTLQLNKFLSQMEKTDWECLFENYNENILNDFLEEYNKSTHIEYFIQNFPNVFICKTYKARFYDFKNQEGKFTYKTDYKDLLLFYKFSNDLESLITTINEEAIQVMQEEIEKEKQ